MIRVGVPFVDHYRVPLRDRLPRWLMPAVSALVAFGVVSSALIAITERHHRRAAEQALCAAQLEAHFLRHPRLREGTVQLATPCATWATVAR